MMKLENVTCKETCCYETQNLHRVTVQYRKTYIIQKSDLYCLEVPTSCLTKILIQSPLKQMGRFSLISLLFGSGSKMQIFN